MAIDTMQDWPLKLRINAAAIRLGSALYYAKAEVYGSGGSPHWDALAMTAKREWIERAEDILRDLKPEPQLVLDSRFMRAMNVGLTLRSVGMFNRRDHAHGVVCLMTFSDGRQLVSETPGIAGKAHTLLRHHCKVRVRERAHEPNVLDRLESL